MAREGKGTNRDGKNYWLTPPQLLGEIREEFGINFDPCPFPRTPDFDGLACEWGVSSYVNPPFAGPTAWVRKSIVESEKGKSVVFVFPMPKWSLMLLTHPNLKSVRNLKDIKWCAIEDGKPGKGIGQHIAMFHLDGRLSGMKEGE